MKNIKSLSPPTCTGAWNKLALIDVIFWSVLNWTFVFVRNYVFNVLKGLFQNNKTSPMIPTTGVRVFILTARQERPESCPQWKFFWPTPDLQFFPTKFTRQYVRIDSKCTRKSRKSFYNFFPFFSNILACLHVFWPVVLDWYFSSLSRSINSYWTEAVFANVIWLYTSKFGHNLVQQKL